MLRTCASLPWERRWRLRNSGARLIAALGAWGRRSCGSTPFSCATNSASASIWTTDLRTAHEQFTSIGMEAFADRARRELLATGERARKRTPEARDELTPQEAQIADLARAGLSNPQIAAQLFLSPRTVEYHLRKVFGKLQISSRNQLHGALTDPANAALVR